jgi:ABC-type uncharacterized transport system permease subunit
MKSKRRLGVLILILTLAFPFRWAFFNIGERGDAVTIASFVATITLLIVGLMLSQSSEEPAEH